MDRDRRAWGAFGSFSLSGELPREKQLTHIEAQIAKLRTPIGSPGHDRSRRLCEPFDFDADNDVDLLDFAQMCLAIVP